MRTLPKALNSENVLRNCFTCQCCYCSYAVPIYNKSTSSMKN